MICLSIWNGVFNNNKLIINTFLILNIFGRNKAFLTGSSDFLHYLRSYWFLIYVICLIHHWHLPKFFDFLLYSGLIVRATQILHDPFCLILVLPLNWQTSVAKGKKPISRYSMNSRHRFQKFMMCFHFQKCHHPGDVQIIRRTFSQLSYRCWQKPFITSVSDVIIWSKFRQIWFRNEWLRRSMVNKYVAKMKCRIWKGIFSGTAFFHFFQRIYWSSEESFIYFYVTYDTREHVQKPFWDFRNFISI